MFAKENPPRVKPLLYVYRVAVEAGHPPDAHGIGPRTNLVTLNEEFRLPYIAELVDRREPLGQRRERAGILVTPEVDFHRKEYERLVGQLELAAAESTIPETPSSASALNDLLVRVRLASRG